MVSARLLVLLVILAPACSDDVTPPRKDMSSPSSDQFLYCSLSCSGCCATDGTCRTGDQATACGSGGVPCVACGTGQSCANHICSGGSKDSGGDKAPGADQAPKCTFDVGCGDSSKWCDVGSCVACAAGKANCDGKGQCECDGTCNGTVCTGTTSCDYYDANVCSGDTGKWCWQNACTTCSSGFFNCNKTKGCECDSAGCNGVACAGKCSGGEC